MSSPRPQRASLLRKRLSSKSLLRSTPTLDFSPDSRNRERKRPPDTEKENAATLLASSSTRLNGVVVGSVEWKPEGKLGCNVAYVKPLDGSESKKATGMTYVSPSATPTTSPALSSTNGAPKRAGSPHERNSTSPSRRVRSIDLNNTADDDPEVYERALRAKRVIEEAVRAEQEALAAFRSASEADKRRTMRKVKSSRGSLAGKKLEERLREEERQRLGLEEKVTFLYD